jgi:hypothetical protein
MDASRTFTRHRVGHLWKEHVGLARLLEPKKLRFRPAIFLQGIPTGVTAQPNVGDPDQVVHERWVIGVKTDTALQRLKVLQRRIQISPVKFHDDGGMQELAAVTCVARIGENLKVQPSRTLSIHYTRRILHQVPDGLQGRLCFSARGFQLLPRTDIVLVVRERRTCLLAPAAGTTQFILT